MSATMRKAIIGIALLAGLAMLVALARSTGGDAFSVDVAPVGRGALAESVLASGNLVFEDQVQLRSELTARVSEVRVEEGDEVQRGDLLIQLDREAFVADLDRVDAAVRAAQIDIQRLGAVAGDLDRQRSRQAQLRERQLVGQDAYDQLASRHQVAVIDVSAARQRLRQAQAERDLALDRLSRTEIRAPIDGRIVSVDVKAGETVIAGTTNIIGSDLMQLADPSVILAELRVDEADIARVELGQPVEVFTSSHPTAAVPGEVVHIGSSARRLGTAEGLAFRVRVRLAPGELALHPGMSCRAEILSHRGEDGLHVPVAAVRRDDAGAYVWTIDADNRARRTPIEAGMASDLSQAVLSGLQEAQQVIIGPGRTLARMSEGARIDIRGDTP